MRISGYHRPSSLDDAVALLERSDVVTEVLAGGTALNARLAGRLEEVVDLQALELDGIESDGPRLVVGAMTTLQTLIDDGRTPATLADLARAEAPRTIRNAATIGGTVAGADPDSVLLAGLLAYGTLVAVTTAEGGREVPLSELLGDRMQLANGIITSVAFPGLGEGAFAGTGRTPADTPIVLVVGHRTEGATTLAATGVAAAPILVDPDQLDRLDPPGDFRGTPDYRRHLVAVLSERVMARLEGGAQ